MNSHNLDICECLFCESKRKSVQFQALQNEKRHRKARKKKQKKTNAERRLDVFTKAMRRDDITVDEWLDQCDKFFAQVAA